MIITNQYEWDVLENLSKARVFITTTKDPDTILYNSNSKQKDSKHQFLFFNDVGYSMPLKVRLEEKP